MCANAQEKNSQDKLDDAATDKSVDLILRGGLILDGTGQPGHTGDVAVVKNKIVAIGQLSQWSGLQTIDCTGLVIAPGFIDLHNHSDQPIVAAATRACVNYLTQGCTTIVTGNCGAGPVDVGDYLSTIDKQGAGTHVMHLLPHGDLRSQVMGKVAREPTEEELAKMCQLAEQAMQDGAWGMSTGLIYVPGTYSKTDELIAIASVVAKHQGIYASHIRNEGDGLVDAIQEALRIGRESKLPVHVSHFKSSGPNNWGRLHVAAEMIEAARQNGQVVTADQYPYIASSTSLDATLLPSWSREGGHKDLEARLATPADRERIAKAVAQQLASKSRIQIAAYQPRRDWVGKSIEEIAALEKRPAVDIVLEIEAEGGAKVVNLGRSEDEGRLAMRLPWVATASDGSSKIPSSDQPHPRSYGTFTRKLGYYALAENVIDLAQAVRSSSGLPAEIIGLTDRGFIKPGMIADLCVFDPKQVLDQATYDQPFRYSTGMRYVYVAGQGAIFEGTPTGALAGKALRHNARADQVDK
ncbi:MAG: D-aminoacylase [Pirellulaceae bacterium]|nr:D-aminoacylase [Pirellulaceae bacterium]